MRIFQETITEDMPRSIVVTWTEEQLREIYNGSEDYCMYGPEDRETFEEYVDRLCMYGPLEEVETA